MTLTTQAQQALNSSPEVIIFDHLAKPLQRWPT